MNDEKYYCTECKKEAMIRYSNWKGLKEGQIVGKDENICTSCMQKRKGNLRIF